MTPPAALALPIADAIAAEPEITLEFMLARLITPIMSHDFYGRFRQLRQAPSRQVAHQPQGGLEHLAVLPFTTLLPPSAIAHGTAIGLRRHAYHEDDINLVGVYGMNVDEQGNIWFSTNHLSIVHKMDSEFNLLEQYMPKDDH